MFIHHSWQMRGKDLNNLPFWLEIIRIFNSWVDGEFCVDLFFNLSGFVLTLSFFNSKKHDIIVGGLFKRYIRLMLPIMGIFMFINIYQQFNDIFY